MPEVVAAQVASNTDAQSMIAPDSTFEGEQPPACGGCPSCFGLMASLPLSKRELSLFRHHNVIHVAHAVPVAQLPIVFSHPCVPVPNDLPVLEGHLTKQTLGALQPTIAGIA